MKKLTIILSLILICSLLCSCGSEKKQAPAQTESSEAPDVTEAAVTPAAAPTEGEPLFFEDKEDLDEDEPIWEEETEDDNELRLIAKSLIDEPVDKLYEAIGYPESSDYAPSCLVPGAEDGNLYYEDFTVYTVRNAGNETVYDVE